MFIIFVFVFKNTNLNKLQAGDNKNHRQSIKLINHITTLCLLRLLYFNSG